MFNTYWLQNLLIDFSEVSFFHDEHGVYFFYN